MEPAHIVRILAALRALTLQEEHDAEALFSRACDPYQAKSHYISDVLPVTLSCNVDKACMSPSGHDDKLPEKLLFGQVKGRRPRGCPRSSFNDVAVRDCQLRRITKPDTDAQNRLLWRDKTCLART